MRSRAPAALVCFVLAACGESERPSGDEGLSVVAFSPEGEVRGTGVVEVRFSAPVVDPDQVGVPLDEVLLSITPPLPGQHRWAATDRLQLVPSEPFRASTRYTVRVLPAATGGRPLLDEVEHVFFTEMFGLASVEAAFEPGPRGVTARVSLELTHAASPEAVEGAVFFHDGKGRFVRSRLVSQAPGRVFDFTLKNVVSSELELHVAGQLAPLEEGEPIGKSIIRRLVPDAERALEVESVQPIQEETSLGIAVRFSSDVDASALERVLSVSPEVEIDLVETYHGVTILGAFAPKTDYRITVDRGLVSRFGSTLSEPYAATVQMPKLEGAVRFIDLGMVTRAAGRRRVDVETVNVKRLGVEVTKVFEKNLVHATPHLRDPQLLDLHTMGRVVHTATLDVEQRSDEVTRSALSVDALESSRRHGLYLVRIWDQDHPWIDARKWLLVTNLGVTAKVGSDYVRVDVRSLADLAAVAGAQVELISKTNAVLVAARTDAGGSAVLRGDQLSQEEDPLAGVVVKKGADFAYLPVGEATAIPAGELTSGGAEERAAAYEAYVYTDMGAYRPGDVVHAVAILRDRSLSTPPPLPVHLSLRDPRGRPVLRLEGTAAVDGAESFDVPLPRDASTGRWTLLVSTAQGEEVGEAQILVEALVPDRIAVEVKPAQHGATPSGSPVRFQVHARNLFGPPVSGTDVELTCTFEERPFTAPGFASFRFEASADGEEPVYARHYLGRFELDASGKITHACALDEALEPLGPVRVSMRASVSEQGGRSIAGAGSVTLHPKQQYVGIRRNSDRSYVEEGADAGLEVVVVDADGRVVPNVPLVANVYEVTWRTNLRRANGRYRYVTHRERTKIDELTITSGPEPVSLPYTPGNSGRFLVEVETPQRARAAHELWTSGAGSAGGALPPQDRLAMTPDRARYDVGDTAVLTVRAPFIGGELLLSVERDRVIWQGAVDLEEETVTARIPILESMSPNAYVVAQLVSGTGANASRRAFGVVPLDVRSARHALNVTLEAPDELSKKEKLLVRVRAEGARRLPHVTVAAVDEGLLRSEDFESPDPFRFFTRRRRLGLTTHNLYGLHLPVREPGKVRPRRQAGAGFRGGAVDPRGGARAASAVIWSGIVSAEADGWATIELDVPESAGTLRLMAVAFAGDRFGAAAKRVRISDPVVVRPSLPRFAGTLDRLRVPVQLVNTTNRTEEVGLDIEAEGRLRVSGQRAHRVSLAPQETRSIAFDLEADEVPGSAVVRISIHSSAGESVRSVELEVRPPGSLSRHVEHGLAKHNQTASFRIPSEWVAASIDARIEVGPTPAFRFSEALAYLLEGPYFGVEQNASRAFPLLYLPDVAAAVQKGARQKGPDVGTGIGRVLAAMRPSGALAFWPGRAARPWTTVYGAHFLAEARRAGHPVDRPALERLLGHVGGIAGGTAMDGYEGEVDFRTQVYALYVLALSGRANEGGLNAAADRFEQALAAQEPEIPVDNEVRALIAGGLVHAGLRSRAATLLSEDLTATTRAPRRGFFSATRADALALAVLADVKPDHPSIPVLRDVLSSRAVNGRWSTTQENAYALLALGKISGRASEARPYWGSVLVGGEVVKRFNSGGPFVLRNGGEDWAGKEVTVTVTGAGKAYVSLRAEGLATATLPPPSSDGLEVSRTFHRPDGTELEQGAERGALVVTAVRVKAVQAVEDVAVIDRLPAGLEIENPRLMEQTHDLEWLKRAKPADHTEVRDDRIIFFTDLTAGEERTFYYASRAVTEGTFVLPHVEAEALYDPSFEAKGGGGRFVVSAPGE